jgi:DNA-binding PadR family transcriptional regulator
MEAEQRIRRSLPMSETAFYILLSLRRERHGYGIMQDVEAMTDGRLRIGAGTLYGTLGKMEKQGFIKATSVEERRKLYHLTEIGGELLRQEIDRLEELVRNAHRPEEV